ncbi:MAG TPA: hypothetical protein VFT72_02500 [Opitutaceae bacterium]|nr:hypothetical protein [Opitutaceae bacterium]
MAVCYRVIRNAIIACLLATAGWLPRAATIESDQIFFLLRFDLQCSARGVTQVFFDVGKGLNEADSRSQDILSTTAVVHYSFALPTKIIRGLRLDPDNRAGKFRISNVSIINFSGHVIARVPPEKIVPTNDISSSHLENGVLVAETPANATDPTLDLRLDHPVDLRLTIGQRIRAFALPWFLTALALFVIFEGLSLDRTRLWWDKLASVGALNPVALTAFTAALAVAIQCRPVIFQGKSFVSPNNGSVMFYETFPTLPGSNDKVVEDTKGSDTAALFHQSLYYPSIERKALARGELPLWNRYFTCGVPLLGQGQSMFGSILNFIPILGDSSATSWDIRFIIGRWLFGFGIGVAIWLLTKSKSSSVLGAFFSTFVGFFEFRLVHMAQFGVEIAPWVFVAWLLLRNAASRKSIIGALGLLFLANWELFTSGTVKEAYMLLLTANACGALFILFATALPIRERLARLLAAVITGGLLLGALAPALLSFARAIQTSSSLSTSAGAWQTPYWTFLGFFEDTFYSRLNSNEWRTLPSVNFALFIAAGWLFVRPRRLYQENAYIVMLVAFLAAAALVFGLIPAAVIMRLPVLKSIGHVHNTFSCVMVVLLCISAGLGFENLKSAITRKTWLRDLVIATLVMALPAAVYFAKTHKADGSAFYVAYATSLVLATAAMYLAVFGARLGASSRATLVAVICACAAIFVWRHAQYVHTPFDPYVFNPHPRPNLRSVSSAVQTVNRLSNDGPHRPAGIGLVMLSGYSEMLNWENAFGVDAIFNKYYYELLAAGNVTKLFWPAPDLGKSLGADVSSWHEDDLKDVLPMQRLLGIDYYLINPQRPAPNGVEFVAKADLDVYHDPHAWPRAFFTNRVHAYADVRELAQYIRRNTDQPPFAAFSPEEYHRLTERMGLRIGSLTQPARDYDLGPNSTKFTVSAPTAGVAVLMENYLSDDFQVKVNGRVAPYLRVNHAFKAVALPAAGDYEIEFRYRPKLMNVAEGISLFSFIAALFALFWGLNGGRKSQQQPPTSLQNA